MSPMPKDDFEQEYDGYDEDDVFSDLGAYESEEDEDDEERIQMRGPPARGRPRQGPPPGRGRGPPPRQPGRRPKSRKDGNILTKLAQQSLSVTGKAVKVTAQHSGKAAYQLIRPKHVDLKELFGLWRVDQQLELGDDRASRSSYVARQLLPAMMGQEPESTTNIQITLKGLLLPDAPANKERKSNDDNDTKPDLSQQPLIRFRFVPSTTFKTAKLEFELSVGDMFPVATKVATERAMAREAKNQRSGRRRSKNTPPQGPSRPPPTPLLVYRAHIHRKLADPSVIKLKGRIYEKVPQRPASGMFSSFRRGKKGGPPPSKLVLVGTFVGRRRLTVPKDAEDDEESEDDEDEDDEWEDEKDAQDEWTDVDEEDYD